LNKKVRKALPSLSSVFAPSLFKLTRPFLSLFSLRTGFVRRVNDKTVSVLDNKQSKRRGYEPVKNETTRQAMKVYFDRSNRDLEDRVFGLEKERAEEVSFFPLSSSRDEKEVRRTGS